MDYQYKNITESGIVNRGFGKLKSVIINSHSSGTLKLYDGTEGGAYATTETLGNYSFAGAVMSGGTGATSRPIGGTITFSAVATTGERVIDFGELVFSNGLYATIGGTSADLTIVYG